MDDLPDATSSCPHLNFLNLPKEMTVVTSADLSCIIGSVVDIQEHTSENPLLGPVQNQRKEKAGQISLTGEFKERLLTFY